MFGTQLQNIVNRGAAFKRHAVQEPLENDDDKITISRGSALFDNLQLRHSVLKFLILPSTTASSGTKCLFFNLEPPVLLELYLRDNLNGNRVFERPPDFRASLSNWG